MNSWHSFFEEEAKKPYYNELIDKVQKLRSTTTVYPSMEKQFLAFELTPISNLKVVLMGQDPYHEVNQANGLAFSVPRGEKIPPSLRNIYKEMADDLKILTPNHGDLTSWAKDGVLLLNAALTVEKGKARSHHSLGWINLTNNLLLYLNQLKQPIVFILLGNDAIEKAKLLNNPKHLVLTAPHPSPLSAYRGFFGSHIFSKTNCYLINNHLSPINWESINN